MKKIGIVILLHINLFENQNKLSQESFLGTSLAIPGNFCQRRSDMAAKQNGNA